jgi:hypothetical protein
MAGIYAFFYFREILRNWCGDESVMRILKTTNNVPNKPFTGPEIQSYTTREGRFAAANEKGLGAGDRPVGTSLMVGLGC